MIGKILAILTIAVSLYAKCVCYYFDDIPTPSLVYNNCKYITTILERHNIPCSIEPIKNIDLDTNYTFLILSGFGSKSGFFTSWDMNNPNLNLIKWSEIAKASSDFLIIDSCFSGSIFKYQPKAGVTITSTSENSLSWNIVYNNTNVSSFAMALRCIFDPEFKCPYPFSECSKNRYDPDVCQMKIILKYWSSLNDNEIINLNLYNWEYPSMGTMMINNAIWR